MTFYQKLLSSLLLVFLFSQLSFSQDKELDLLVDAMCVCITSDAIENENMESDEVEECFEDVMGQEMDQMETMFEDSSKTDEENDAYFQSEILPKMMTKLASTCPQVITFFMQAAQKEADEQADSLISRYELGIEYTESGNPDAAIEEFNKALQIEESKELYNLRGVAKINKGDFYSALSDFSRALELDPEYSVALGNQGFAKLQIGDFNNAITDIKRSLAMDSVNAKAYNNLGLAYIYTEQFDLAEQVLNIAIEQDSVYLDAWNNRGYNFMIQELYENSIADYKKALSIDSTYTNASFNIAFSYENLGYFEKAKNYYNLTLKYLADNPNVYNRRGLVNLELELHEEAIEDFQKAFEIDSTELTFLANQAFVLKNMEEFERSLEVYSQLIEKSPDNLDYIYQRGIAEYEAGLFTDALVDFSEILNVEKTNAEVYDYRARTHVNLENYQEAIDDYTKSIEIYNADPVVFKERGENHLKLDQTEKACSDFNKAKALDSEEVDELLAKHCKE
ncbi:MAG: tetratricopeptide repeat protein [Balneola sp.]